MAKRLPHVYMVAGHPTSVTYRKSLYLHEVTKARRVYSQKNSLQITAGMAHTSMSTVIFRKDLLIACLLCAAVSIRFRFFIILFIWLIYILYYVILTGSGKSFSVKYVTVVFTGCPCNSILWKSSSASTSHRKASSEITSPRIIQGCPNCIFA